MTVPGPAALRRLSPLSSTAACDRSPDSTSGRTWPSSAEAVCAQPGATRLGVVGEGRVRVARPMHTSSQTHCWGEAGGRRQKETLGGRGGAPSGEPCCSSWGAGAQGAMPGQRPPPRHARPGLSMSSSACGFVLSVYGLRRARPRVSVGSVSRVATGFCWEGGERGLCRCLEVGEGGWYREADCLLTGTWAVSGFGRYK